MTIEELKALFETGKDITQEMFETLIDELQGADGVDGKDGAEGKDGDKGDTGEKGDDGASGKSAYEIAQDNGFEGSEQDWLESLKGDKGETGTQGETGQDGTDGAISQEDYDEILSRLVALENSLNDEGGG